jgi:hypothetical protein
MKFICDTPDGKTWFRIETEAEAHQESALMDHAVEKHFRREKESAMRTFKPASTVYIGNGLATAMLPPNGRDDPTFRIIIVGPRNSDPYIDHKEAIGALGAHFGLKLDRDDCFPYRGP